MYTSFLLPLAGATRNLGQHHDNLEKDYLGNAVAGDNVMVIDANQQHGACR